MGAGYLGPGETRPNCGQEESGAAPKGFISTEVNFKETIREREMNDSQVESQRGREEPSITERPKALMFEPDSHSPSAALPAV